MHTTPRFLQGVYAFEGKGLDQPLPVDGALSYVVPDGVLAQPVYFRGGNSADELICVLLILTGQPLAGLAEVLAGLAAVFVAMSKIKK